MSELLERIGQIARSPRLLVACDFDGTLVPIAARPALARIDTATLEVLRTLTELPQTNVAVVSGRSRRDLVGIAAWPPGVRLVGSHGLERDEFDPIRLSPEQLSLREQLLTGLKVIASSEPGFVLEEKPAGVAFHYRLAPPEAVREALQRIHDLTAGLSGLFHKAGDQLIEYFVVPAHKGSALSILRFETGAAATVFIGDDVTDEDGFASLDPGDLGVKVGEGPTVAAHRVADPTAVRERLAALVERRRAWLAARRVTPLERHSVLSDQRTLAVVDDHARIVWMCAPRLDSLPLFAELVGGPQNGFFGIEPTEANGTPTQHYEEDTLSLCTSWPDVTVVDLLDCSDGRPFHRAGRSDLLRFVSGRGRARLQFAPRLNFGRTPTRLAVLADGVRIEGTPDPIVLRSPGVPWELVPQGIHQTAVAEVCLNDNPLLLELRYGTANLASAKLGDAERRRQTEHHWRAWVQTLRFPPIRTALLRRSALLLRALCYRPTGAIAAAATTSLPEWPGGTRNWDYRFCWLRDAAMAAASLVRLGSTGQALRFLDWLMGVLERTDSPESLRPLYTVSAGHLGPEAEIAELDGYSCSKPVRISNAAADQVQLDVFGPITDLIAQLAQSGAPVTPEHWRLTEAMVAAVQRRWTQPDSGIWEIRLAPRHNLHSKVMCWVTLDRAQRVAEQFLGSARPEWSEIQARIAQDVLTHGYKPALGAFTASYEVEHLDAAVLHVGLSGLLPADDPRFRGTVDAVERTLRERNSVYRYRYPDGLPGGEGAFHLCTSWLIQAYAMIGRHQDARELFESLAAAAGPTGLLTEEFDPATGCAWGNLPQAYSHLGLIDAAVCLAERS